jgi:hypothetical protein
MMLRLAVAPGIPRPTWSPTKSKPNGGVSIVSGNQIGPHHRIHLGIPRWREMSLFTGSQSANLVRIVSLKFHTPDSLTGWVPFRPKTTTATTTEEFVQGVH